MNLINREKSSHWYSVENGVVKPCYELPKKSGEGMRSPTIRDARELHLLPSVTTILSVLAKPGLEAWKLEKAITAALTLPRLEGEPLDMFARRAVEDSERETRDAANLGTRIHDAIEQWLLHKQLPGDDIGSLVEPAIEWLITNVVTVLGVELLVHNPVDKYAGRLDLVCQLVGGDIAVIDIKSQAVKKEPAFYRDSWPLQLAAYSKAKEVVEWSDSPMLVSLVVDSKKPGFYSKVWLEPELYWRQFLNCLSLWKYVKEYETKKRWNTEAEILKAIDRKLRLRDEHMREAVACEDKAKRLSREGNRGDASFQDGKATRHYNRVRVLSGQLNTLKAKLSELQTLTLPGVDVDRSVAR